MALFFKRSCASVSAVAFLAAAFSNPAFSQEVNALALNNGAVLKSTSSEYGGRDAVQWTALALIDESPATGWSSAKNKPFSHSLVFELSTLHRLTALSFDNKETGKHTHKNYAAKGVTISVSTQSANGPFVPIVKGEISVADKTDVKLQTPADARWVKVDIDSNAGREGYTTLMELSALGTPLAQRDYSKSFRGTYKTNWGNFYLTVNGTQLRGCYDHDEGVFAGDLVDGVMNITWREGKQIGTAALALTEDGTQFSGFWNEKGARQGTWLGTFSSDPAAQPTCATTLIQPVKSSLAQSLDSFGTATLYGIYFDFDSDVIKASSGTTLNQVLAWLKSNPAKRVVFEGHTDAKGDDAYNLNLSNRRAAAVAAWLSANGINAGRMTFAGLGESQPVADNATERGRSLNRRVEVRIQ